MDDATARQRIASARTAMRQGDYKRAKYILELTDHPLAHKILDEIDNRHEFHLPSEQPPRKAKPPPDEQVSWVWRTEKTVPSFVIKLYAFHLFLSMGIFPVIVLISSGYPQWAPVAFFLAIPLILLSIIITYLQWRCYWTCLGISSLLGIIFMSIFIAVYLSGRIVIPVGQFLR